MIAKDMQRDGTDCEGNKSLRDICPSPSSNAKEIGL